MGKDADAHAAYVLDFGYEGDDQESSTDGPYHPNQVIPMTAFNNGFDRNLSRDSKTSEAAWVIQDGNTKPKSSASGEGHITFAQAFAQSMAKKRKRSCCGCWQLVHVWIVLLLFFIVHEWLSVGIALTVSNVFSRRALDETQTNSEEAIDLMFVNAQKTVSTTFQGLRQNLLDKFNLIIQDLVRIPVQVSISTLIMYDGGLFPSEIPIQTQREAVDDIHAFFVQQLNTFYDSVAWVYMGLDQTGHIAGVRGAISDEERALDRELFRTTGTHLVYANMGINVSSTGCLNPNTVQAVREGLYDPPNSPEDCDEQSWDRYDCRIDTKTLRCLDEATRVSNYNVHNRPWYTGTRAQGSLAKPQWSSVYLFSDPFVLGISITVPLADENQYYGLAAADLVLEDIRDQKVSENGVSFLVERANQILGHTADIGLLIAVSDGRTTTDSGGRIRATESENLVVAQASKFILQRFGSWENISAEDQSSYLQDTLMPCPESDNPLVDRAGCQLLQVSIVQDPYGLDWVLVTIFPELDFMEDIFTANAEALRRVESSKADTEETIDNALILSLGIACGWILVSLAMAWLAAKTLSSPLGTLSSDIKRLAFLEFGHPEDARPSFIREINNMQRVYANLKDAIASFSKFVPESVVRRIVSGDEKATQLYVVKKEVCVMFADVENFTNISESLGVTRSIEFLSGYLQEMCNEVQATQGTIGDFIGDGLMIFWNSPDDVSEHWFKACECALGMQDRLIGLNKVFRAKGFPAVRTRIGINLGQVVTGNIGSLDKMKFGVVGDTVNLSSRVENLNKHYSTYLLITDSVYQRVKSRYVCRPVDKVAVKGRTASTLLYELMGRTSEVPRSVIALCDTTKEIFSAYQSQQFSHVVAAIDDYERASGLEVDGVLRRLRLASQSFLEKPPGPQWDGVRRMEEK